MIHDGYDRQEEYAVETDLLRTFTTVARTGSFTVTAQELGFVQSTVTGHIQALEKRLGVRLLDRLRTGTMPTDAGTRLLEYATAMIDLETRLEAEVPAGDERATGPVRVIAPESLCAYRLPTVLAELRAQAPDVRLNLVPGGTAQALRHLRDGRSEGALLMEPAMAAHDLRVEPLGPEELTLLVAPGSDLTTGPLEWANLADHDALLLEEGCSYSDEVARQLLAVGQPGSRRVRFGSIEAVKRCVAAGLGWAVLPTVTATDELHTGTLASVTGPLPAIPTAYLATLPERTLNVAAHTVFDQLRTLWATDPAAPTT